MTPRLTDTHCHLMLPEFSADLDRTLERAQVAGIRTLIVPGVDLSTSREAVTLAESHPGMFAAVGIHPHQSESWSQSVGSELRELARSPAVKAIGEIGLDYYRDRAPRPAQRSALEAQLELADELGLPVIVHNRAAIEELLAVLIEWSGGLEPRLRSRAGVLHAFSGEPEHAQTAIGSGFYIGVAGPLTYPNASPLRELLQRVSLERLLLETDSPYLPPQSHRGQRNEPAHLPEIATALAKLHAAEFEKVAQLTSQNASVLFDLSNGSHHTHLQ
ncbi:MAG: TatD family hydrolase [Anaerolineales bacterium]